MLKKGGGNLLHLHYISQHFQKNLIMKRNLFQFSFIIYLEQTLYKVISIISSHIPPLPTSVSRLLKIYKLVSTSFIPQCKGQNIPTKTWNKLSWALPCIHSILFQQHMKTPSGRKLWEERKNKKPPWQSGTCFATHHIRAYTSLWPKNVYRVFIWGVS